LTAGASRKSLNLQPKMKKACFLIDYEAITIMKPNWLPHVCIK